MTTHSLWRLLLSKELIIYFLFVSIAMNVFAISAIFMLLSSLNRLKNDLHKIFNQVDEEVENLNSKYRFLFRTLETMFLPPPPPDPSKIKKLTIVKKDNP